MRCRKYAFWGFVLVCITLAGCAANLAAVKGYSDETKKLTASFEPMLTGSISSCEDRYKRRALFTNQQYDFDQVEKRAKELCAPIATANPAIADLNNLLADYADALSALADSKLPSYKGELDGLAKSLGDIKNSDGTDYFQSKQLTAVNALAEFLSRIVTQQIQTNALKDALRYHTEIVTIADALKTYATRNYGGYINDELTNFSAIQAAVRNYGQREPLAARYLETQLAGDKAKLEAKKKAIDTYSSALDHMVATHKDLADNVDKLDSVDRLKELLAYANEVRALRSQLREAF